MTHKKRKKLHKILPCLEMPNVLLIHADTDLLRATGVCGAGSSLSGGGGGGGGG